MTNLDIILLVTMTITALWTVVSRNLLKAAIGLAMTSAVITILMFRLASPLAAVFELSVCAGLITVVFVSTISLAKPMTHKEMVESSKNRIKRFWYLPVIIIIAAIALYFVRLPADLFKYIARFPNTAPSASDVRTTLWNLRQLDLFGQIIVIIIGALGVVILFKERGRDE